MSTFTMSAQRLEACDIRVAVFVDEKRSLVEHQLIRGEDAARESWRAGALVFDAQEMLAYCHATPTERALFLSLKRIRRTA